MALDFVLVQGCVKVHTVIGAILGRWRSISIYESNFTVGNISVEHKPSVVSFRIVIYHGCDLLGISVGTNGRTEETPR